MSRIKVRITITNVAKLKPGDEIRDSDLAGFCVRLQKSGEPSYFVHKRMKGGKLILVTIGKHGSPWTPKTARDKAVEISLQLASGINPNQLRKDLKNKSLFSEVAERFLIEHGAKLKPRTIYDYRRMFNKLILPNFGKTPIDQITRADITKFHFKLKDTPRQANHTLAVISKLMNWSEQAGLRPESSNPVRGIQRYKEHSVERYLSQDEFSKLGDVLDQAHADGSESPFAIAALRLYLFTGARRGEILSLKWSYVDLDAGIIRLPDSKTGKKTIHLNEAAIDVLREVPRVQNNPYVIVGRDTGQHLVNITKVWHRIRKLAGLNDVRLHDLRHSFASTMASSGGSLLMIGKLLGHTQAQTTQRYAHLVDDPVRKLNQKAGDAISAAMNKS